jgi:type VI protein secretion system component Hcp
MYRLFRPAKLGVPRRTRRPVTALALLLLYALPWFIVPGLSAIYMKYEGVEGGSAAPGHEKWIDLDSFSWGASRDVQSGSGGGVRTRPAPSFHEVVVSRRSDKSSPLLFFEAVAGNGAQVDLDFVAPGQTKPYYQVFLKDVLVSGYSQSSGGDRPSESLSLNYTHFSHKVSGSDLTVSAFYDLKTGDSGVTEGAITDTAPSISAVQNLSMPEGGSTNLTVTVSDNETPAAALSLTRTSSDTILLPLSGILLSGSGSSRTVTLTPAPNESGSADVTLTVSDGALSSSTSFTLTVDPINDPPTVSAIPDQVTALDTPIQVDFTVGDADHPVTSLAVSGTSTDTALVPDENIVPGGSGSNRFVTITPAAGQWGTTRILLTVTDGQDPVAAAFNLTVNAAASGAPTNILLDASSVAENSANDTVVGALNAEDPDPDDTHTFTLTDSAGGRFKIEGSQLRVNEGALLDYESATGHVVVVQAVDGQTNAYSQALSIAVLNVNEPPALGYSGPSPLPTVQTLPTAVTGLTVADPDAGAGSMTLTLSVSDGILGIAEPVAGSSVLNNGGSVVTVQAPLASLAALLGDPAGIAYASYPGFSGTDTLTATLDDNGHSGSGSTLSVTTAVPIRVYLSYREQWQYEQFGSDRENGGLEDTVWGDDADPDGDRMPNLIEYALGLDPAVDDRGAGPRLHVVDSDEVARGLVTLDRRRDPFLDVYVEVADDLAGGAWSSDPADIAVISTLDLGNGFDRVVFEDQHLGAEGHPRHYRLRVVLRPFTSF